MAQAFFFAKQHGKQLEQNINLVQGRGQEEKP